MFEDALKEMMDFFDYYSKKFGEEVAIEVGIVSDEEMELDLVIGLESHNVYGIKVYSLVSEEDDEDEDEGEEDEEDLDLSDEEYEEDDDIEEETYVAISTHLVLEEKDPQVSPPKGTLQWIFHLKDISKELEDSEEKEAARIHTLIAKYSTENEKDELVIDPKALKEDELLLYLYIGDDVYDITAAVLCKGDNPEKQYLYLPVLEE